MTKLHSKRHQKALRWAALALVLCTLPLAARVWLDRNGAIEQSELGVVGDFVVRDEFDHPLTKDQLRRALTLVIYWPKDCVTPETCREARTRVEALQAWVQSSLEPKWTEEKNHLHLLVLGEGALGIDAGGRWRRFPETIDAQALLPASASLNQPWCVVIDNVLQFAALENLNTDLNFRRLGRVISKTSFDQYLGNYLSRRTFMGPKRTQQ